MRTVDVTVDSVFTDHVIVGRTTNKPRLIETSLTEGGHNFKMLLIYGADKAENRGRRLRTVSGY